MEEKQKTLSATGFSGKYLVASLFILSGILLFARNMGWITAELFSTIVSWYSLFIILGIYSMIRRHFVGGIILLLIGVYFLLGGLSWLPENSQATMKAHPIRNRHQSTKELFLLQNGDVSSNIYLI